MSEGPKESHENNTELREIIKRLETEMSTHKKRLEIATEEREKLISSLALANGVKEIMETKLQRTMEELKVREEEFDCLQKQLKMMTEAENKKQEQHNAELDEIRKLRREISIARETRKDLEADINLARQKLKESSDRELKLVDMVDSLKEREQELGRVLMVERQEKKLNNWMDKMSLKNAAEREEDLKNKLMNLNKDISASSAQKVKELNETVKKYSVEKNNLEQKLGKITLDKEMLMDNVKLLEGQVKKLKSAPRSNSNSTTVPIERVSNFMFFNDYNIIIIIEILCMDLIFPSWNIKRQQLFNALFALLHFIFFYNNPYARRLINYIF